MELSSTQLYVCKMYAWKWATSGFFDETFEDIYQDAVEIGLRNSHFIGQAFKNAIKWGLIGKYRVNWQRTTKDGERFKTYSLDAGNPEITAKLVDILTAKEQEDDDDLTYVDEGRRYTIPRDVWLKIIDEVLESQTDTKKERIIRHYWGGESFQEIGEESEVTRQGVHASANKIYELLRAKVRAWRSQQERENE